MGGRAFAGDVSEYAVKAAYIFNFANFVQWPTGFFQWFILACDWKF